MATALADTGVTTFAQDGSRQPTQYSLGAALGAPRYPNNGNGTAILSGTPATAGTCTLTITAKNAVGTATQTFTLTVS